MRNKTNRGKEPWISRKAIIVAVIVAPLMMFAMSYYNYIRLGKDFNFEHILDVFTDLFIGKGLPLMLLKDINYMNPAFQQTKFIC